MLMLQSIWVVLAAAVLGCAAADHVEPVTEAGELPARSESTVIEMIPVSPEQPAVEPEEPVVAAEPEPEARQEPEVAPEINRLLERIEARMKGIQTLQTRFRWDKVQEMLGDEQVFTGQLFYDAKSPAKFSAHIQRSRIDERNEEQNRWVIFDGQWLAERDHRQRTFVRRQVVEPDAPESRRNPLGLGQGPFPLPLDADRERILARFSVTELPALQGLDDEEIPNALKRHIENAYRLRLVPRPETRLSLREVQLWYHRETLLPLRVQSLDDSRTLTIFYLFVNEERDINQEVEAKVFDTSPPTERGWNIQISALEDEEDKSD